MSRLDSYILRWRDSSKDILLSLPIAGTSIAFLSLGWYWRDKSVENIEGLIRNIFIDVGPFFVAFVLFISLWASRSFRLNIVICGTSIVIALYSGEALCSLLTSISPQTSQDTAWDTRSRLEVIRDFRAQRIRAGVAVYGLGIAAGLNGGVTAPLHSYKEHEILPLSNLSHAHAILCNENGTYAIATTDRYGFPNPDAIWDYPERLELAVLGDSFTAGACVKDEVRYVSILRSHIPLTLNFGVPGNGPLLMLATLREYVQKKKPRHVVWAFYEGNDLVPDHELEKRAPTLTKYINPQFSQNLITRQEEIDDLNERYLRKSLQNLERSKDTFLPFKQFIKLFSVREIIRPALQSQQQGDLPSFRTILSITKDQVTSWGGQLHFLFIPSPWRYYPGIHPPVSHKQNILTLVSDLGIPIIDGDLVFNKQAHPEKMYYNRNSHCNEKGYAALADALLNSIKSDH